MSHVHREDRGQKVAEDSGVRGKNIGKMKWSY